MKKTALILAASVMMMACKKDKETITTNTDSAKISQDSVVVTTKGNIAIDYIAFPDEITECSCYFAKNKSDFNAEKYIYVDDAGENAYAMLDGQRRVMKLISSSSFEDESESLSKEIETNEYKISIKAKKLKEQPEAMLFEGTMTVEKPSGEKITTPIYGECAC